MAVFGRSRVRDRERVELTPPERKPWRETPVIAIGPPMAPVFTQHCEFRPICGLPFSGQSGESRCRAGCAFVRWVLAGEEADLIAAVDTYWPVMLAREHQPRPMATIAFTAQIPAHPAELALDSPLYYRGLTLAAHDGYFVEQRELWTEAGQLVVLESADHGRGEVSAPAAAGLVALQGAQSQAQHLFQGGRRGSFFCQLTRHFRRHDRRQPACNLGAERATDIAKHRATTACRRTCTAIAASAACRSSGAVKLVTQLHDQALGGLFANAGNALQTRDFTPHDGIRQLCGPSPDSAARASFGPTPDTDRQRSNTCRSSSVAKPRGSARPREPIDRCRAGGLTHRRQSLQRRQRHRDQKPTPPTSTTTVSSPLSTKAPCSCAITRRLYQGPPATTNRKRDIHLPNGRDSIFSTTRCSLRRQKWGPDTS